MKFVGLYCLLYFGSAWACLRVSNRFGKVVFKEGVSSLSVGHESVIVRGAKEFIVAGKRSLLCFKADLYCFNFLVI